MVETIAPATVVPQDFPELALLAWNRDPRRPITSDEAFSIYENNWRHIDVGRLSEQEIALIEGLKRKHGNGFLLTPG